MAGLGLEVGFVRLADPTNLGGLSRAVRFKAMWVFVRHGESQANLLNQFSNRGLKHPLSPHGRLQVRQLAWELQGQGFERVYSSPVLRALESSVLLAHALEVEYQVRPELSEIDVGILEDRQDAQSWQQYFDTTAMWAKGQLEAAVPQGESAAQAQDRAQRLLRQLPQQKLLLVSHGSFLRWGLAAVLGYSPALLPNLGPCQSAGLEWRNGQPQLLWWGEANLG